MSHIVEGLLVGKLLYMHVVDIFFIVAIQYTREETDSHKSNYFVYSEGRNSV
jgi:hypothetical protein